MRIVGEIPHSQCKITLYAWNNRYLVKLEQGYLEQTFKIDQYDLTSEADLQAIVNEDFIKVALRRFDEMGEAWGKAVRDFV